MMCNAGFGIAGAIDEIAPEQMQKLMDINYFGTYHATRAALPVFRRQGSGHIIIVSSIVGKRGVPYMGAYSATKFAQVGLAECLRSELVGTGIHVSVVYPGVDRDRVLRRHVARDRHDGDARHWAAAERRARSPTRSRARSIGRSRRSTRTPSRAALVMLNALAPGFCDRVVKRFGRKPLR